MGCIGEMTALFPVKGPNFEFISRFLDRSVGFAAAWMLWCVQFPNQSSLACSGIPTRMCWKSDREVFLLISQETERPVQLTRIRVSVGWHGSVS